MLATKNQENALVVSIVLLLLPALYLGSYLALVTPRGTIVENWDKFGGIRIFNYRCGGEISETIYCPLEQIDRKARRGAWER